MKPKKPLGAPSITLGSTADGATAGHDSDSDTLLQQVSDSRSGFDGEWERMGG